MAQIDREIDGLIKHLADVGALPGEDESPYSAPSASDPLTRLSALRRSARGAE